MTKKLSRKLARKNSAKDKKRLEREVAAKMNMFDKLAEKCFVCEETFDKQDKAMVQSWYVIVKNDKPTLYCPKCWNEAQEIINDFRKRTEDKLKERNGQSPEPL